MLRRGRSVSSAARRAGSWERKKVVCWVSGLVLFVFVEEEEEGLVLGGEVVLVVVKGAMPSCGAEGWDVRNARDLSGW